MKYAEFKQQLTIISGTTVSLTREGYIITDINTHTLAVIDSVDMWCASSRYRAFKELQPKDQLHLMSLIMAFASTAIADRRDESYYYVHMRTLNMNFTEYSYLTFDRLGNFYRQGSKSQNEYKKNRFTKQEIEQIRLAKKIDEVTWKGMIRLQEVND